MTDTKSDEVLNMSQRTVLQYLSLTDWKLVNRLPIRAGELIRKCDSRRQESRRCGRQLESHPPAS